jgi:hypothetical protein
MSDAFMKILDSIQAASPTNRQEATKVSTVEKNRKQLQEALLKAIWESNFNSVKDLFRVLQGHGVAPDLKPAVRNEPSESLFSASNSVETSVLEHYRTATTPRPAYPFLRGYDFRSPLVFAIAYSGNVEIIKQILIEGSKDAQHLDFRDVHSRDVETRDVIFDESIYHLLGRMEPCEACKILQGISSALWFVDPEPLVREDRWEGASPLTVAEKTAQVYGDGSYFAMLHKWLEERKSFHEVQEAARVEQEYY